jgi:hypothetical protein
MNAVRVETTVDADGELHLTELPCPRGDKVEAIVLILEQPSRPATDAERDKARAAVVNSVNVIGLLARPFACRRIVLRPWTP